MSGVPFFFSFVVVLAASLFALKRMSGLPLAFTGDAVLVLAGFVAVVAEVVEVAVVAGFAGVSFATSFFVTVVVAAVDFFGWVVCAWLTVVKPINAIIAIKSFFIRWVFLC